MSRISTCGPKPAAGRTGTLLLRACLDSMPIDSVDYIALWPSERSRTLYRRLGFEIASDIATRRIGR